LWLSYHLNVSYLSVNCISINLLTKSCQDSKFSATKVLRKETLSGLKLNMSATVAFLLRAMLYMFEYCYFKGAVPNHESSQNLIWLPSLILKLPMLKKFSLTFINPFQNYESPGFLVTCVIALEPMYLFFMSCCHAPSELIKLKSHLLRRHLFCNSSFRTPSLT
jgi:hypothetical protein